MIKALGLTKEKALQSFYGNAIEFLLIEEGPSHSALYKILSDAAITPVHTSASNLNSMNRSKERVLRELGSSKSKTRLAFPSATLTCHTHSGSVLVPATPSENESVTIDNFKNWRHNESLYSSNKNIPSVPDKLSAKHSRVGSPKPSALDRLKKVFQGERNFKSPTRNIRVSSPVGSPSTQDHSLLRGLLLGRKTEENPAVARDGNTSGEFKLSKEYKSMNNLGQGFAKKKDPQDKSQAIPVVEAKEKDHFEAMHLNSSKQDLKTVQLERRIQDLAAENAQLKQRNSELEKHLSSYKQKNNVGPLSLRL